MIIGAISLCNQCFFHGIFTITKKTNTIKNHVNQGFILIDVLYVKI